MWRVYKFLSNIFPSFFAAGQLTVNKSGEYQISLPFTPNPDNVWLDTDEVSGAGVCNGEQDGFDKLVVPNGIVIIVKLYSQSRTIRWVASR